MASFVLDVGLCQSFKLEKAGGSAIVKKLRERPHGNVEFSYESWPRDEVYAYSFKVFPMYGTKASHLALHKGLEEAFLYDSLNGRIKLLAYGHDQTLIDDFRVRTCHALRLVPNSHCYSLFVTLKRDKTFMAEWMVTDPLAAAQEMPAEYGR